MKPPEPLTPTAPSSDDESPGGTLRLKDGDATGASDPTKRGERDLVGRILAGRYAIERVIGRGGMGIVYEARHVTVGRRVAVKVLRPDLARNAEATMRFQREAQVAGSIGHEHIVEVFDFGYSDEGDAYIAMELLEGTDLGALVRESGPLPVGRALEVARQVASALGAAHEKGIVHRDLKSENVFVVAREGRDFVKVVDFGISKVLEADENQPITHEGTLLGTPHYMAPEQSTSGADTDARADLYALGCILFEVLTGRLPFTGKTPMEVMYKHNHEPRPRPSAVRPEAHIPPALDAVVVRAMAVRRDERYASAAELIAAFQAIEEGRASVPVLAAPRDDRERAARTRLLVGVGVAAALLVSLGWRAQSGETTAVRRVSGASVERRAHEDAAVQTTEALRALPSADASATTVQVVVTLVVSPERASIAWDGADAGTGVLVARAARGTTHTLHASATGHVPREESVTPDGDMTLRWTLAPTAAAPVARRTQTTLEVSAPVATPEVHDAGVAMHTTPDGLKLSPYRVGGTP